MGNEAKKHRKNSGDAERQHTARHLDDGSNMALLIDQSEEISDSLKRGKQLSPDQSRSLLYLVNVVSNIKDTENIAEKKKWISVFSNRLKRFTDVLKSAGDKPNLSIYQAENDMEFLLEIANEYLEGLPQYLRTPGSMALLRGARAKLRLLDENGGCLSGSELAELLGVDRNTPRKKHTDDKFIAIKSGGRLRYPIWQIHQPTPGEAFKVLPGISDVIEIAKRAGASSWDLFSFFLTDNIHLVEESNSAYSLPIDALKAKNKKMVVCVAEMTFDLE